MQRTAREGLAQQCRLVFQALANGGLISELQLHASEWSSRMNVSGAVTTRIGCRMPGIDITTRRHRRRGTGDPAQMSGFD